VAKSIPSDVNEVSEKEYKAILGGEMLKGIGRVS